MTNEMILEYSAYIYGLAKYFKNYPNKEDLYQVGCIGLLNAYKNYDSSYNAKFSTYAYPYILGEMYKLVREDKKLKISQTFMKLSLKIEKANILLAQKLNRYPTTKELADYLECSELDIIECLKASTPIMSTDSIINNAEKELTILDTISSDEIKIDTLLSIKEELNNLTEEEKTILNYNINNYTQEEIANILGINQVKVSRRLAKIKEKIRSNIA